MASALVGVVVAAGEGVGGEGGCCAVCKTVAEELEKRERASVP
jgi:hypothetical protein